MAYCNKCGGQVVPGNVYCAPCRELISAMKGSPEPHEVSPVATTSTAEDLQLFVGPKADKYLLQFKKFELGDTDKFTATWHWPALFAPFWWLLYRKLYSWAAIAFIFETIPFVNILSGIVWALLANYLYYKHAKNKLSAINRLNLDPETKKQVIANSGGTGKVAVFIAAVIAFIAILGILAAIAIPQFESYRNRAHDAATATDPGTKN